MNASFSTATGGDRQAKSEHQCPRCVGPVFRLPHRPLDLFISNFLPVRRFRCNWHCCGWEGRLRLKKS